MTAEAASLRVPRYAGTAPSPAAFAHMAAGLALTAIGFAASFALHSGVRPRPPLLVLLMLAVTLWAAWRAKVTRSNLLPRMMLLVFALPFSVLLGFLVNPNFAWVYTPRGYALGLVPEINSVILLIGLAGVNGMAAGLHFVAAFGGPARTVRLRDKQTLGRISFALFVAFAVILSQMSAAPQTVFDAAYSAKTAAATAVDINFPAAFLISYVTFVLLWIDVEREENRVARNWKIVGLGVALAYVTFVLQVLRGDRESSGLVAALAALYLTAPALNGLRPTRAQVARRIRRLVLPLLALVLAFVALGRARESGPLASSRVTFAQAVKFGWHYNTWTAILWTNLGTAWEYQQGLIKYRLGSTYRDYLLSIPPGVIAKAYGYERPQESWQGLAYEDPAHVSAGGLHVVIPSFKNFGAFGVVAVMALYGILFGVLERAAAEPFRFFPRLLWGSIFCASFLWFWYGEMTAIRAVMAAIILGIMYRLGTLPHAVFSQQPVRARLTNHST